MTLSSVPLGYCVEQVRSRNTGGREQNLLSLSYGEVVRKDIDSNEGLLPESFDSYNVVEPGDTILRLTDLQNDQRSLRVGLSTERGIITSAYVTVRPGATLDGRFLNYFLKHMDFQKEFYALGAGVRQSLKFDELRRVEILIPPLSTQQAIADYLDTETARIDALIEKKKRMIELQSARFDALVRDSVLGAGDTPGPPWAHAPMANDRSLTRIGAVLEIRGEKNDPIKIEQVLSLTASRGVIPYEEKGDIGNKASEDISRYSIVRKGDIVLNSMNVIIGSVGLSAFEGVLSPVYYVLKPLAPELVDRRFLAYHFRIREFQRQLIRLGYGILEHRMRIPWVNLKSQQLALPPTSVQREVAERLDAVARSTEEALAYLHRQIDLLTEKRQALITAAVTGELDIPEAA